MTRIVGNFLITPNMIPATLVLLIRNECEKNLKSKNLNKIPTLFRQSTQTIQGVVWIQPVASPNDIDTHLVSGHTFNNSLTSYLSPLNSNECKTKIQYIII